MDKRWLEQAIKYAKQEYEGVWMASQKPHHHKVHAGLSRYYDINVLNDLAEAESGWDMTTRFGRKCLDFLPIDLNVYLYKYEVDFEQAAKLLGKPEEAQLWHKKALKRKKTDHELMWNNRRDSYVEYNFVKETQSPVASLAAYTAMWAGMASKEQAKKLVRNLNRFEMKGGLATTEDPAMQLVLSQKTPAQWAYPNGWAPLHFFVVKGLERYGYKKEARRIAIKWLKTNLDWFNENGVFNEKYNVVDPSNSPIAGLYPSQSGFGWTNAIFEKFCQEYIDK
jgi:alpha,alpha-trehalase